MNAVTFTYMAVTLGGIGENLHRTCRYSAYGLIVVHKVVLVLKYHAYGSHPHKCHKQKIMWSKNVQQL